MKKLLIVIGLVFISSLNAQFFVTVDASPSFTSKEAILYTLDGSKDIISSKELKKGNQWKFKVPAKYVGMMKVYFPDTNNSVTFISENKDVKMNLVTDATNVKEILYQDESNILMERTQGDQKKNELIFPALVQIKEYYKDSSDFGQALKKEIDRLGQKTVISAEKNPFVYYYNTNYSKYLVETSGVKPPTQDEIIHFLSSSNEMLESSSLLRPILVSYLNSGTNQNVSAGVDKLLTAVNVETPRGQTVLSELIDIFDVYSMEELKDKYLTQAKNLKCTINNRLASTINANKNVELGAVFPNYKFTSVKNTSAKSLHEVKADKKVIVFWSSTCSHCEKELPQLLEKYNQMKAQKIEVIGLSLDSDADSYNKRIATLPWINDSELRGWNSSFAETYNIHATPTYFILDANNKIIAKPDHVGDVLQYFSLK